MLIDQLRAVLAKTLDRETAERHARRAAIHHKIAQHYNHLQRLHSMLKERKKAEHAGNMHRYHTNQMDADYNIADQD